ncbi:Twinfilin-1 [Balamuthia mandrillaris]
MTHSSRIPVSNELENAFANARTQGGVRYIQVSIENETLIPVYSHPISNDLQRDLESVASRMKPKTPAYFLFRLDTENLHGNEWMLMSFVPDGSPVKQRMLYASTRDILKKQLGKNYFGLDMYGSEVDEFNWASYQAKLLKPASDAPLTTAELHLSREATAEVAPSLSKEYVHSVQFPLSSDAQRALQSYGPGTNFVQLSVDTERETIELVKAKRTDVSSLANEMPSNEPRFAFFKYCHTWEDTPYDNNVFIYWCPDTSSIKQRMLYSTVKSVVSAAGESVGIFVDRNGKIEACEPEELSVEAIHDSLHPKEEVKKKFARPMRPGRGRARLTKRGE